MTVAIINLPGCNNVYLVGIYCSKSKVPFSKLIEALEHLPWTILCEPDSSHNFKRLYGNYLWTKSSCGIYDQAKGLHSANKTVHNRL